MGISVKITAGAILEAALGLTIQESSELDREQ